MVTFLDTAAIQNSIDRKFFKYGVKMRQIAKTFEQFELKRMATKKGHNNNINNNNNNIIIIIIMIREYVIIVDGIWTNQI